MTIEEFLRMLLRNALLLVVVTVLGGAAGYGASHLTPPVYAATALGYVSASTATDAEGLPIAQSGTSMDLQYAKAQSFLPLFGTRAVGQRVVDELGLAESPDAVAGSLQASIDPNAPIVTVTARADTPEEASAIANAAVEATAAEAEILEVGPGGTGTASVRLVPYQTALVPGAPASPDREKYLLAGAALGLLLGMGLAWLRSRNDSRLRSSEEVTALLDTPVLGSLPEVKDFARGKDGALTDPEGFAARESVRKLRTNLRFVDVDDPPRSIVITSSTPEEGKSTVAAHLARVMARAGQPTLLIDADLRRPTVAAAFGVDGKLGLSQLLAKTVTVDDALQPTDVRGLTVLPAGQVPPNPSELLGSRSMRELVAALERDHFVIVDAPPLLAVTDAQLLSRQTDGILVVVVPGRTRGEELLRAVESVRGIGGVVHGTVLNRVPTGRLTRMAYGSAAGYGDFVRAYRRSAHSPEMPEVEIADIDSHRASLVTAPAADAPVPASTGRRSGELRARTRARARAATPTIGAGNDARHSASRSLRPEGKRRADADREDMGRGDADREDTGRADGNRAE